jgi:hypothetical protein
MLVRPDDRKRIQYIKKNKRATRIVLECCLQRCREPSALPASLYQDQSGCNPGRWDIPSQEDGGRGGKGIVEGETSGLTWQHIKFSEIPPYLTAP